MSIVRWGSEGSDCYIYEGVTEAGASVFVCAQCRLPRGTGEDFTCSNAWEMRCHMEQHRRNGDCVPDSALARIARRG